MRQRDTRLGQRGIAAMEMAIGLLVLVPLLMVLLEGARALLQYSTLQNAAMEGARMLVRDGGDTSGVASYIQNLVSPDDPDATSVNISDRDANNNVTVQVDHVFTAFFQPSSDAQSQSSTSNTLGTDPFTLSAGVTVALPETN